MSDAEAGRIAAPDGGTLAMNLAAVGNRNQRRVPTRGETNARAAVLLRKFIVNDLGISIRQFAARVGVPEETLRFFLGNGNPINVKNPGRRHSRGPYPSTLMRLLDIDLPDDAREALLDVIHYEDRVVARIFRRGSGELPAQSCT